MGKMSNFNVKLYKNVKKSKKISTGGYGNIQLGLSLPDSTHYKTKGTVEKKPQTVNVQKLYNVYKLNCKGQQCLVETHVHFYVSTVFYVGEKKSL